MHQSQEVIGSVRPLQDYVLLKPVKEEEKIRGGILLPQNIMDYGRCEVVAVGRGVVTSMGVLVPNELKVGDFVYIQKFADGDLQFRLNGERVFCIRERHLNCAIDAPPKKGKKKRG